jgi:hypothetical protein
MEVCFRRLGWHIKFSKGELMVTAKGSILAVTQYKGLLVSEANGIDKL